MTDPLERLWTEILSRQPDRIRAAFQSLPPRQKVAVRAHLIKMSTEPDWHPPQIESAKIALDALKNLPDA